jgi:hypothetical protein
MDSRKIDAFGERNLYETRFIFARQVFDEKKSLLSIPMAPFNN